MSSSLNQESKKVLDSQKEQLEEINDWRDSAEKKLKGIRERMDELGPEIREMNRTNESIQEDMKGLVESEGKDRWGRKRRLAWLHYISSIRCSQHRLTGRWLTFCSLNHQQMFVVGSGMRSWSKHTTQVDFMSYTIIVGDAWCMCPVVHGLHKLWFFFFHRFLELLRWGMQQFKRIGDSNLIHGAYEEPGTICEIVVLKVHCCIKSTRVTSLHTYIQCLVISVLKESYHRYLEHP